MQDLPSDHTTKIDHICLTKIEVRLAGIALRPHAYENTTIVAIGHCCQMHVITYKSM